MGSVASGSGFEDLVARRAALREPFDVPAGSIDARSLECRCSREEVAMRDPAPMTFTLEDYDRLVDGREDDRRFELVDGQIFAFAGAMPVHNALVSRMVVLLDGIVSEPCRVYSGQQGVRIEERQLYVIPDIVLSCEATLPQQRDLLAPLVIVEILSPATRDYDIVRKRRLYASLPSLANFVFVDTAERRVTVFTREREAWWSENSTSGESFAIANVRFRFEAPVDELYQTLVAPAD